MLLTIYLPLINHVISPFHEFPTTCQVQPSKLVVVSNKKGCLTIWPPKKRFNLFNMEVFAIKLGGFSFSHQKWRLNRITHQTWRSKSIASIHFPPFPSPTPTAQQSALSCCSLARCTAAASCGSSSSPLRSSASAAGSASAAAGDAADSSSSSSLPTSFWTFSKGRSHE